MRIAVIADTHDRYLLRLLQTISTADEIWHLGDVIAPSTYETFAQLGRPLHVVRGNCDSMPWPYIIRREIESVRYLLIHRPEDAVNIEDCDIILHGHTHLPRDETIRGIRWLNPGSIADPRCKFPASFAWLTIENGQPPMWKIIPL